MFCLVRRLMPAIATIVLLPGCDDYSHNGVVNTPPPNYVTVLGVATSGGDGNETSYSAVPISAGSFMVVGTTTSWGYGDSAAYIAAISPSAGAQWEKFPGGWGADHLTEVLPLGDGNYVMVGTTSSINLATQNKVDPNQSWGFDYTDLNVYIVKTDSEGSAWWERAAGSTSYDEVGTSIVLDGSGYKASAVCNRSAAADVLLVSIDPEGHILGQTSYEIAATNLRGRTVKTDDGSLVFGGSGRFGTLPNPIPVFVKLNGAGAAVWQKTFSKGESYNIFLNDLVADGNGAVGCGYAEEFPRTDSAAVRLYLIKVDGDGNKVWDFTYDQTTIDEGRALVRKADGSFIVAGQNRSTAQIDICKISSDGLLQWSDNTGVAGEATNLIVSGENFVVVGGTNPLGVTAERKALLILFAEDLTNL